MSARARWNVNTIIGGLFMARSCLRRVQELDKLSPELRRRCSLAIDICDELIGEIRRAYFIKYGAPKCENPH